MTRDGGDRVTKGVEWQEELKTSAGNIWQQRQREVETEIRRKNKKDKPTLPQLHQCLKVSKYMHCNNRHRLRCFSLWPSLKVCVELPMPTGRLTLRPILSSLWVRQRVFCLLLLDGLIKTQEHASSLYIASERESVANWLWALTKMCEHSVHLSWKQTNHVYFCRIYCRKKTLMVLHLKTSCTKKVQCTIQCLNQRCRQTFALLLISTMQKKFWNILRFVSTKRIIVYRESNLVKNRISTMMTITNIFSS